MKITIGIDVGGTEIKIGKFQNMQLLEKHSIKTNTTEHGKNIIPDIVRFIKEKYNGDSIVGIGMGVPGPVVDGVIYGAHNLGWKIVNLKGELQNAFLNTNIEILNDANAAALGEMVSGSGSAINSFVFVTLGTGIGGAIIIDKKIHVGATGSSGEIGHLKVECGNKRRCNCGLYDCVECYSSATGIVQTANMVKEKSEMLKRETDLTCEKVFSFAKNGDFVSEGIVDMMVDKLAIALSQIANTLNPEAFIIGGGVSKAGEYLLQKLQTALNKYVFHSVRNTKIILAKLGNDAGIYGCAYSVMENKND